MTLAKPTRQALGALGLLAGLAFAAPASAAIYIKFDGVDGETKFQAAPVAVSSVSWPAGAPRGCSGQAGGGKVVLSGGNIATPGQRAPRALLSVRKAGDDAQYAYELKNILITSVTAASGQTVLSYGGLSWSAQGCR